MLNSDFKLFNVQLLLWPLEVKGFFFSRIVSVFLKFARVFVSVEDKV